MEITDRDLAILQLVAEHRVLTQTLVLQALSLVGDRLPRQQAGLPAEAGGKAGPSPTNLSRRLAGLFHGGFLDRILPARGVTFRGDAFAYGITTQGEKKLRERQPDLPFPAGSNWKRRNEKLTHNPPFTRHSLMIARARIAIAHAVREMPALELVTSEREGPNLAAVWERGGRRCRVVPDAFVEFRERSACAAGRERSESARSCFLEADRGTMESRRMLAKLEDYALAERDGKDREVFGVRDFLVLLVAETKERASFLLDLAAGVQTESPLWKLRRRVFVTAEESYIHHPTNIFAQVWRRCDLPEERAAIVPSPLARR